MRESAFCAHEDIRRVDVRIRIGVVMVDVYVRAGLKVVERGGLQEQVREAVDKARTAGTVVEYTFHYDEL